MRTCAITGIRAPNSCMTVIVTREFGEAYVLQEVAKHFMKCASCGYHHPVREMNRLTVGRPAGRFFCDTCYNTRTYCRDCDKLHTFDNFDGNVCIHCASRKIIKNFNCRAQRYLHFLNHDPKGKMFITKEPHPTTLYYGVEFELQIKHEDYAYDPQGEDAQYYRKNLAQAVLNKLGKDFVIAKHDGSIGYGFEVVTAPATLVIQRARWSRFLDWLDEDASDLFNVNSDKCGIHIHASRSCLTKLETGKIISFLYNPANAEFITLIAERGTNHYSQWDLNRKVTDVLRPTGVKYEAFNLNNAKTVELRIFQTTGKHLNFFKNLEFFDALISFSKTASINDAKERKAFIAFVLDNAARFPSLVQYMKNAGVS